ncbi:protein of unknown function [Burkholderia multivorans]
MRRPRAASRVRREQQIDVVVGEPQGRPGVERAAGERAAQPQAVDQRGEAARRVPGLRARQRLREFRAQVRVETPRVDALQAAERWRVHALRPEREPGLHHRRADLRVVEIRRDDRAKPRARLLARRDAAARRGGPQIAQHVAHRGFEQAVLVAEIVADDARRNVRPLRDRRERRARQAGVVDRAQRRVDQLGAADLPHSDFRHRGSFLLARQGDGEQQDIGFLLIVQSTKNRVGRGAGRNVRDGGAVRGCRRDVRNVWVAVIRIAGLLNKLEFV